MSGIVPGSPLDRATEGYFCSPIGRASRGYWCYTSDIIDTPTAPKPVGGNANKPIKRFPHLDYLDEVIDNKEQQTREDEEILLILKLFLKCR